MQSPTGLTEAFRARGLEVTPGANCCPACSRPIRRVPRPTLARAEKSHAGEFTQGLEALA